MAETFILAGRVAVNGQVISELGSKADPDVDVITLDGRRLQVVGKKIYLLLNKPAGYMTTLKDPQGRPLVVDLVKGAGARVFPVGRLDYNTEGLLLLTNDGDWANALAHPRHEVEKEYHVRVQGKVTAAQITALETGIDLEDGRTAPAKAKVIKESENNTWMSVSIHEGRYRQVRRMCSAVGLSVVRLKRVRYGHLELAGLKPGDWRELSLEEVKAVLAPDAGRPKSPHQKRKIFVR